MSYPPSSIFTSSECGSNEIETEYDDILDDPVMFLRDWNLSI
jgi:hypothetical protein